MDGYNMLVRPCQHCTDAPCEKVCPTTARHTREKDGLVLTDYDVCIGCRYCQVACPYGVNYFQWDEPQEATEEEIADQMGVEPGEEGDHMMDERGRWVDSRAPRGVMSKCTMCPTRQDGLMGDDRIGTTACEEACPPDAIQFGDVNDERSDAHQHGEYPSKSRAIIDIVRNVLSPEAIDGILSEDDDLESAIEAFEDDEDDDLDRELVSIMKAIEIVSDREEPPEETNDTILEQEQTVLESVDALEEYVDLESEDVLAELQLGDGSEDDANLRLRQYAGVAGSSFKLLEDIGTNPNVTYIGQNPGPNAEQVDGPVAYDDIGQTDDRKEVLDEGPSVTPGCRYEHEDTHRRRHPPTDRGIQQEVLRPLWRLCARSRSVPGRMDDSAQRRDGRHRPPDWGSGGGVTWGCTSARSSGGSGSPTAGSSSRRPFDCSAWIGTCRSLVSRRC